MSGHTPPRFDNVRALFVKRTLKRSHEGGNTHGQIRSSGGMMLSHAPPADTSQQMMQSAPTPGAEPEDRTDGRM